MHDHAAGGSRPLPRSGWKGLTRPPPGRDGPDIYKRISLHHVEGFVKVDRGVAMRRCQSDERTMIGRAFTLRHHDHAMLVAHEARRRALRRAFENPWRT